MAYLIDYSERGDEVRRFDDSLKRAKSGIMEACELWEDMKSQFSERGSYGERYSDRARRGGYSPRDWDEMDERRYRDGRGRYM